MIGVPKERPAGVTILAVLFFIAGTFYASGTLVVGSRVLRPLAGLLINPLAAIVVIVGLAITLVQAALFVAIGIGFLKLQNWARVLLIVLIGLGFLTGARALVTSGAHGIVSSPGPTYRGREWRRDADLSFQTACEAGVWRNQTLSLRSFSSQASRGLWRLLRVFLTFLFQTAKL